MIATSKLDETNQKHLNNPCVGDYWSDHFCPVCVVVAVNKERRVLQICKVSIKNKDNTWSWDSDKIDEITFADFKTLLSYTSPGLQHKTWADVSPEHMKEYLETLKADKDTKKIPLQSDEEDYDTICQKINKELPDGSIVSHYKDGTQTRLKITINLYDNFVEQRHFDINTSWHTFYLINLLAREAFNKGICKGKEFALENIRTSFEKFIRGS